MGLLKNFLSSGKTLLFADAFERHYTPWIVENYKSVLSDLGVKFWYKQEFAMSSGFEMLMAGAFEDFAQFVDENIIALKEMGISRIIVCSDEAYFVMKKYYEGFEIVHALDLIVEQKGKLMRTHESAVVYYDSIYFKKLGYKRPPRDVLFSLGLRVREYPFSHEVEYATGTEALLNIHSPRCASRIASELLRKIEGDVLVVASPRAYVHLKKHAEMHDVELRDVSEFLVEI